MPSAPLHHLRQFRHHGLRPSAAIGAVRANPDARVLVIDGDGSFRMNFGELPHHRPLSAQADQDPAGFNNHADGLPTIRDAAFGSRHPTTERASIVDFAAIAKLCHFDYSVRVEHRADLEATECPGGAGPAMLEVVTIARRRSS